MKHITGVDRQRKNATRRSIFLDEEFAFGVAEETYLRYSLFVGRSLSDSEIEEILKFDQFYRAKRIAMARLDRRLQSESEIRKILRQKEFPVETIEQTIIFLIEFKQIDDKRFASAYINDRLLKKKISRGKLRLELKTKGLRSELISGVIAETIDDEAELELARQAAISKNRTLRINDLTKREASLVRFLKSRGFLWSAIKPAIEMIKEDWADNADLLEGKNQ